MVERTIAHTARELAGQFYDFVRSAEGSNDKVQISKRGRVLLQIDPKAFGKTYPTVKDYLAGRKHGKLERLADGTVRHIDDGSIRMDTPGWLHFYDQARTLLVQTLANPGTHDNIKGGIYDAIIEDREKQMMQRPGFSPKINQRKLPGLS